MLDRLEYWLLDLVVDMRVTIRTVASPEHGLAFNRKEHGASEDQLAESFGRLYGLGLIDGSRTYSDDWRDDDPVLLSVDAVLEELNRPPAEHTLEGIWYELTAAGGVAWEQGAHPDWDRFVSEGTVSIDDDSSGVCQIEASTPMRALEYLNYLEREHFVDPTHYQSIALAPWQATYWKRLPNGVRFEFERSFDEPTAMRTVPIESEFFSPEPFWYTQPWQ